MKLFICISLIISISCCSAGEPDKVRKPMVAGTFYPDDPQQLKNMISEFLKNVSQPKIDGQLMALISPHAGYVYSGHVNAEAYAQLSGREINRVVVISPSHTMAFSGVSVYPGDAYQTPSGNILVDRDFCKKLVDKSKVCKFSDDGHGANWQGRSEHALEVQLPFLQRVLGDFKLAPLVMGDQEYPTCRDLAYVLADLIPDEKTLIIASSDLSHFHSYDEAVRKDRKVTTAITDWDYFNLSRNLSSGTWEACGGGPIVTAMIASEKMGATKAQLLKYANSGDVQFGDKSRVVGYSAFALYKPSNGSGREQKKEFSLSKDERKQLLKIVRRAVKSAVQDDDLYDPGDGKNQMLEMDRGAFVTLKINHQLRGCIGYTAASQPLKTTVRDAAIHAALRDPRFSPVQKEELKYLQYEISVLSPFRKVLDVDQIEVGKHGLLIQKGNRTGLLLPQVPVEQGWDRQTFLEQICRKAGLPRDAWKDVDADLFMYTAFVFGDH